VKILTQYNFSASNTGPYSQGTTIRLIAQSVTGASYLWSGPGGFTSTVRAPSIPNCTSAYNGTYIVTITTAAGCVFTATTYVVVTGTPRLGNLQNATLSVSPNPTTGLMNFDLHLDQPSTAQWSIIGLDGRAVLNGETEEVTNITQPLNLTNMSNGIYLLRVNVGGQVLTQRVVLAR
jgi:hypothetical protein